jgi:hypothetical protein
VDVYTKTPLEENRADAGYSILVGAKRKSRSIGNTGYNNDLAPYFIQHLASSIKYLFDNFTTIY